MMPRMDGLTLAREIKTHTHEHNHPPLTHAHDAHEDPEKEHLREAHIHDHARPDVSPG
jgi:CheY-like chemotaxis protein